MKKQHIATVAFGNFKTTLLNRFYIFEANCPKFKILKNTKTPDKLKIIHFMPMLMLIFSDKMHPKQVNKNIIFYLF